jgi:hypothetical protein
MTKTVKKTKAFNPDQLHKCPTGIKGFDQITEGGLPRNRVLLELPGVFSLDGLRGAERRQSF